MGRELRERLASKGQPFFYSLDLLPDEYQPLFSLACTINESAFPLTCPGKDATDHAPHTPKDKAQGAPGISGIELAFPILFTRLVKPGLIPLSRLSRGLSLEPARILGLNKGLVKEGFDGDLVLIEDEPFTASEDFFLSKNSNTPLLGTELRGRVWATIHKGEVIYLAGKVKGRDFDDHRQVI